jgi:hypothetical protein
MPASAGNYLEDLLMSTSRRKFLRTGLLATLFAAVPLRNVLAQSWKQNDGNPTNTPPVQTDPLFNYTEATFRSYLNSVFQMHTTSGIVAVTLEEVDSMPAAKAGECFTLLFRGGARAQNQDSYTMVHGSLGTFELFLVPTGTDQNGAQGYLATINRLSAVDFANMTAPSRVAPPPKARPRPAPATLAPPATQTVPAVTPAVTPSAPTTAPVTPASVPRKSRRKHRPAWKNQDDGIRISN